MVELATNLRKEKKKGSAKRGSRWLEVVGRQGREEMVIDGGGEN